LLNVVKIGNFSVRVNITVTRPV